MSLSAAYGSLYIVATVLLGVGIVFCLWRAIRGPHVADRIISVNMICTLTVAMICILAILLNESYLIDVELVYTMLGFLAVCVLCKVFMGVTLANRANAQKSKEITEKNKTKEETV